jgi:hypothetical protein
VTYNLRWCDLAGEDMSTKERGVGSGRRESGRRSTPSRSWCSQPLETEIQLLHRHYRADFAIRTTTRHAGEQIAAPEHHFEISHVKPVCRVTLFDVSLSSNRLSKVVVDLVSASITYDSSTPRQDSRKALENHYMPLLRAIRLTAQEECVSYLT